MLDSSSTKLLLVQLRCSPAVSRLACPSAEGDAGPPGGARLIAPVGFSGCGQADAFESLGRRRFESEWRARDALCPSLCRAGGWRQAAAAAQIVLGCGPRWAVYGPARVGLGYRLRVCTRRRSWLLLLCARLGFPGPGRPGPGVRAGREQAARLVTIPGAESGTAARAAGRTDSDTIGAGPVGGCDARATRACVLERAR